MNITRTILIGIPALALLAGCHTGTTASGTGTTASTQASSGPATTAASGGGATTLPSCPPAATVNSALGVSGLQAPKQSSGGAAAECLYENSSVTAAPATISMLTGSSAAALAKGEQALSGKGEPVKAYPGVGDQAYAVTIGAGSFTENLLSAVKGSLQVTITSGGSLSNEGSLATQLFSQAGS